jgi:four helix bundle protein
MRRWDDRKMRDKSKLLRHFRDLEVYQMAFDCAMRVYKLTKEFPREEKFSLSDQIQRSSRSVCSNIGESWRKRKYKAVFINKLTDAMEASETQTWLDFCLACNYINKELFDELDNADEKIIAKLNAMERKADAFCF